MSAGPTPLTPHDASAPDRDLTSSAPVAVSTRLSDITPAGWRYVLGRTARGFLHNVGWDMAAGLTFFSVTGTLPLVIALVSILGVVGQAEETMDAARGLLAPVVPEELLSYVMAPLEEVIASPSAGFFLVISLVGALFTASAYVTAFGRAVNRIYGMEEMRSIWLLRPAMMIVTLLLVLLLVLGAVVLLAAPAVVTFVSGLLGVEAQGLVLWSIARWPLLVIIPVLAVTLLLHATPNVRQPGLRYTWPGAALAIGLSALALRGLFAWVSAFGDVTFNRTFGALATPLVVVLALFLSNIALVLGAELNAAIERVRELQAGVDAIARVQLAPTSRRARASLQKSRRADAQAARALLISQGRTVSLSRALAKDSGRRPRRSGSSSSTGNSTEPGESGSTGRGRNARKPPQA